MKRSSKWQREFGLEEVDLALLRALVRWPKATPSQLARELLLPRTTVHFRLQKLAERRLCEVKKIANLSSWNLTPLGSKLTTRSKVEIMEMSLAEGDQSFNEALIALASEAQPCRVYMFEPSEQTKAFSKHVDEVSYARVSDLIKKNDIIVEVLFGEESVKYAQTLSPSLRRHMYGRPTIAYELSDDVLNFEQMILCFADDTYFFNYQTLRMTHIRSREVTASYRTIFEFYKTFAKKINLNEAIKP